MADMKDSPVSIEIGTTGINVVMSGGESVKQALQSGVKSTLHIDKMAEMDQPQASEIDPPTLSETKARLRQLTEKAILCAMEKLNTLLATVTPSAAELTAYMDLTLKLMDAKESFEWADAFRAAILKNPKLLSPNGKGLGARGYQTRTNATIAQRLDRGDTRTTPKRLIANMPEDDDAKATG